eukprot:613724-Prymnesium_polylepis.1
MAEESDAAEAAPMDGVDLSVERAATALVTSLRRAVADETMADVKSLIAEQVAPCDPPCDHPCDHP